MRKEEHYIAVALVQWWSYYATSKKLDERLLFAIPNGGLRKKGVAGQLYGEGVRAGVPDYFLAIPNKKYSGMFLELKSQKGRARETQVSYHRLLKEWGYYVVVTHGLDESMEAIKKYVESHISSQVEG
jgi:hypothetical protein